MYFTINFFEKFSIKLKDMLKFIRKINKEKKNISWLKKNIDKNM